MKINEKIKSDDFITLDYNKIRDEVKGNITIYKKPSFFKNRYIKLATVCIVVLLLSITGIIIISNSTSSSNKYLQVSAAEQIDGNDYYSLKRTEGYEIFKQKLEKFSSRVSDAVYKKFNKEENYVISPLSIYMALAMSVESTDELTRAEILDALGMTYEEVSTYTKVLYYECNGEVSVENVLGQEKVMYRQILKNSIWVDNNIKLNEAGLNKLSQNYNCSSYSAPFKNSNRKANKAIRDYVKENTKGLIDQDFNLDEETLFTLINTYYLKDTWRTYGDELFFTNEKYMFNDIIETYLLSGRYLLGKPNESEKFTNFYTQTSRGIKVEFIIPKDGYTINDIYNYETLEEVNTKGYIVRDDEKMEEYNTRCFFPEFEAEFNEDISNVFKDDFNINEFFTFNSNFSPLTNEEVKCGGIIHSTKLTVDKIGIEGAAVTVLPGAGAPGPGEYTQVYIDYIVKKNFILIISKDNVDLFSGVVYNI